MIALFFIAARMVQYIIGAGSVKSEVWSLKKKIEDHSYTAPPPGSY